MDNVEGTPGLIIGIDTKKPEKRANPEIDLKLNSDLARVINDGLNLTIGHFYQENESYFKTNEQPNNQERGRVLKYLTNLDRLGNAISGENFNEGTKGEDKYCIREQYLDKDTGTYFIRFTPESKIDTSRKTKSGAYGVNLDDGPVLVCQIAINTYDYSAMNSDPSEATSKAGWKIDYSLRSCSLQNGQLKFSSRLAGIVIKADKTGSASTNLIVDIGNSNFVSNDSFVLTHSKESIPKVVDYFSSLGINNPI